MLRRFRSVKGTVHRRRSGIEWPGCKLPESKHRSCQPKTQNKTTDRPGTDPVSVSGLQLKHSEAMPDAI